MVDLKGAFNVILSGLIINSSLHIQEQRTGRAIFHLLNGKRSIQTVQDAHLFGVDRYYGILPTLTIQTFEQTIDQCVAQGFLTRSIAEGRQTYLQTTMLGEQWMEKISFPFHYFDGLLYYDIDNIFLERLLLLIQVLTNSRMNHSSYIPVIDKQSVMQWIKRVYPQLKHDIPTYINQLYDDLYILLRFLKEEEAHLFVDRLSGYEHYGLSTYQMARKYDMSTKDIQLYLRAITHRLLALIKEKKVDTQFMSFLTNDLPVYNFMTQSAQTTYQLMKKQRTAQDIARIRQLKMSTIYDHIVEIAWYDQNFPVQLYIDQRQIDQVKQAILQTKSLQLKTIKDNVGDDLTYFQIRLAFTRIKNVFSEGVIQHDK